MSKKEKYIQQVANVWAKMHFVRGEWADCIQVIEGQLATVIASYNERLQNTISILNL